MPRIKSKQIIGERPINANDLTTKQYVDEKIVSISSSDNRKSAYFHSLSKVMTNTDQSIHENKYKGSHNITGKEIWTSDITIANTYQEAVEESLINDAVKYYDMVTLDNIYGSNGQTYCYIENGEFKDDTYPIIERGKITSGGVFIRPLIGPEDVYNSVTNEISHGYELRLFRGSDATIGVPDSEIDYNEGEWYVNYYTGTIHFSEGFTPLDLGWGTIKASFFKYNGGFIGDDYNIILKSAVFENNKIIFNKNTVSEQELDLNTLILSDTIKNISLNNNKELIITRSNNSTFVVNLKPVINDVVNDVIFNNNKLFFYKNNDEYLEVNIDDILLNYDLSFVDAGVFLDELVFTRVDGTTHSIHLSLLQDRSAFNQAELRNNLLIFTKQSDDIDIVDLNEINLSELNPNILVNASFNDNTNILTFELIDGNQTSVNLNSLSKISILNTLNINMSANNTSPNYNLACNLPILSPNILGSNVMVFINGIQAVLGDDNSCECYFSNDGGVTKKMLNNINFGDKLYWTYNNSLPNSGYELSIIDKITFNYLIIK